jgi:3',5'-cyclic AMP phosphodiesterase CpdA
MIRLIPGRDVPALLSLAVVAAVVVAMSATAAARAQEAAQQYVTGIVYADQDNDGRRSAGEPGIPGVMVSNQRDVVLTDAEGRYRLPVDGDAIVFVTKPPGYALPLDANSLPQFYYIHQPDGSPPLEYPGIEPTGPLPESVDFGLIPSEPVRQFRVIAFGDPQPRNDQELSWYRDAVVAELLQVDSDFVIVLGDIMYDDLSLFPRYDEIMRTLNRPVYNIIGNHDINFDADGNRHARETFKRHYGPTYYSFEYGDVHFIALDNLDYAGRNEQGSGQYRGYLHDTHLEWLGDNLRHVDPSKLIVLLAHIPLYTPLADAGAINTINREALFALLEDRDRVLFLGGHLHITRHQFLGEDLGRRNPVPIHQLATSAASGSWWSGPKSKSGIPITTQRDGVPNGYHVITFDGNAYREQYKAAGLSEHYQMRIEAPERQLARDALADAELRVNVFNGTERSEVRFRIGDDGDWIAMERLDGATSRFFEQLRAMHEEAFGAWMTPVPTNHIWRADLPDLPTGVHAITVRTRDMYGQEFEQTALLEVE